MEKTKRIGLALSGGGYRAAAYHIGTLRALQRLGILPRVDVISSVSGGSITAAYYALHKENYEEFERSFIEQLKKGALGGAIVNLLVVLAAIVACVWIFGGWALLPILLILFFFHYKLMPLSIFIERAYNRLFFHKAKLSDLPDTPMLAINSTDVCTGTLFTFSKKRMMGYKYETSDNQKLFKPEAFPVARAVMASSCVPFAFSPVKIAKRYYTHPADKRKFSPVLIDGGLYDNQGAHKLSEQKSIYFTPLIIVSDAGVGGMNARWAFNIPLMLYKTTSIMMRRIKTFQLRANVYHNDYGTSDMRYAYISLGWEPSDEPLRGFVRNLANGNIAPELLIAHHITPEEIDLLRSKDQAVSEAAFQRLLALLKQNLDWEELNTRLKPTDEEYETAKKVGTNLTALQAKQIDALIKHSHWHTEVQIRLYMPYLLQA
ncbi:MAG: patatin-like phospholipase family protein [Mediterranea sp.]|jgi:NTE family protein|nr:patatin-like phospholipase family protein [Mediterranea sp.]